MDPFVVKNITFGVEDSVISISGALLGINAANLKKREVVVSGFIVILVGALSMMYGAFVSDSAYLKSSKENDKSVFRVMYYSLVMFFSYFSVGLLLLSPFYFGVENPGKHVLSYASVIFGILLYNNERDIQKTTVMFIAGMSLLLGSIAIGDQLKI